MIDLLDLSHWVTEISNQCPVFGGRVFQTIPDEDLSIDLLESPVAFVYLSSDKSDDNRHSTNNTARQNMASDVTVESVIRRTASATDKFNTGLTDQLRTIRIELFNALIGFHPADVKKPVHHILGELVKKELKVIKWADSFSAQSLIVKKLN